mmetsp:Transcript_27700/g.81051  ORF Transcript_27700/g.81051 Transcript_27700/m.81051 type:complete len:84 (+) Transcript_27700:140-391(+)
MANVQPQITATSEVRVRDDALAMDTEFLLRVPLPAWWPLPDGVGSVGNSLIRGVVDKDTKLSVTRIKADYAAWRRGAAQQRRV